MKGMSVLQIMMILTVVGAGLFVILMGSVGETPIYYHTLPEIQFSELLSSFYLTEKNLERSIKEDSDRFFNNIQDNPIPWDESWGYSSFESDFENLFGEELGKAANGYFSSVYVLEGANVNASILDPSGLGSVVSYNSGTNKLTWDYTYRIFLSSKMFGADVKNEINTTRTMSTKFDFMDLHEVYNCANSFFADMSGTSYNFQELTSDELETGLTQELDGILKGITNCDSFDISLEIPISCGGFNCDCRNMKETLVTVNLVLSQKGKGSVAFSEEFGNFVCGDLKNNCLRGSDCTSGEYCIKAVGSPLGFCGSCLSSGIFCSPSGSTKSLLSEEYKCYKIRSDKKEYKCLKYHDNLKITLNGKETNKVNLNCVEEEGILKVQGATDYFFEFNGVRIEKGDLDLCDTTKVPRVNGRLIIYAKSGSYDYELAGINVNFALSGYMEDLNNKFEDFVYYFDELGCTEFRNNVENKIEVKIKGIGVEGYTWDIKLYDKNMNLLENTCTGETSWSSQQYSPFKIDFKENGDVVATAQYIIEYKPKI